MSFNSSNVDNFLLSWSLKDCIKVQEKKKKVVVLCSVSASATQHMWELLAGNCTALFPRHARGRRIRSYPSLCASCYIRETEDWGEFNISLQLCTMLYREIVICCAAFLRKYSYICSHYGFTSFYAMCSPGNFKVSLTLTLVFKDSRF